MGVDCGHLQIQRPGSSPFQRFFFLVLFHDPGMSIGLLDEHWMSIEMTQERQFENVKVSYFGSQILHSRACSFLELFLSPFDTVFEVALCEGVFDGGEI